MLSYLFGIIIVVGATETAIRTNFVDIALALFSTNKHSITIITSNQYTDDEKQKLLLSSMKANLRNLLRLAFNFATLAFIILSPIWLIDTYLTPKPLLFDLFTNGLGLALFSSICVSYGYARKRYTR